MTIYPMWAPVLFTICLALLVTVALCILTYLDPPDPHVEVEP